MTTNVIPKQFDCAISMNAALFNKIIKLKSSFKYIRHVLTAL